MGEDGDVEEGRHLEPMAFTQELGKTVRGHWATRLQGCRGVAAPTIPRLSAQLPWQLSGAAEHWPRRLSLSHQRIARDDCEPSHVRGAVLVFSFIYIGSGDKTQLGSAM